jgi:8-oxo-dGTP pyrophosphatase MutT (NUDIX family)
MLKFLLPGNWADSQVFVNSIPSSRQAIPLVEAAVQTAWENALAKPGVHLFDGPMCRLEAWTPLSSGIHLTLSPTSYKLFLGTNMANPQFADQFGPDVMANPLGVSTALLCGDRQLLLGHRTASVAYYPDRAHPFAGCMEPKDRNPFTTARRELTEELSLGSSEFHVHYCTGLIEDTLLQQPELTFIAETNLTRSEIQARLDATEHRAIWSIPASAPALEQVVQHDPALTPVAIGTLLLWGRLAFGEDWFASIRSRMG